MRILSFSQKWDKLQKPEFTTFRYPYWKEGEVVQVFYKNRSPNREKLGVATIIKIEDVELDPFFSDVARLITDQEAIEDGFKNRADMVKWMRKTYGLDFISRMNKLTLSWQPTK